MHLIVFLLCVTTVCSLSFAPARSKLVFDDNGAVVLIMVHSEAGWTSAYAQYVLQGCEQASADPRVLLPAHCVLQWANETTCADVEAVDSLIVGTPTYFANMAGELVDFFSGLETNCFGWPAVKTIMSTKVGGAFATGGSSGGGYPFQSS